MLRGTHKKYSVKLLNIYYVLCTVHCVELWVPEGFFCFHGKATISEQESCDPSERKIKTSRPSSYKSHFHAFLKQNYSPNWFLWDMFGFFFVI